MFKHLPSSLEKWRLQVSDAAQRGSTSGAIDVVCYWVLRCDDRTDAWVASVDVIWSEVCPGWYNLIWIFSSSPYDFRNN